MLITIAITALAWLLASTSHADAGFLTTALFGATFAATLAGKIVTLLFSIVASVGFGLLRNALRPKQQQEDRPIGVKLDVEVGDQSPLSFLAGYSATAGTRKYIGSWGQDGKTPNAYLTDVIQIGDLPAPGQPGLWVNGQKCTILWHETPAEQGYPVQEFRVDGKDHLWIRYRDGTETTSDAFLLAKFGGLTDRPWRSDMIGLGTPIAIVTALVDRDLFPGQVRYLFEPPVLRWYDLRKDSTAGGSGSHRWSDWSTWEPTTNPMVIIYNIIRGIYYGVPGAGEWVYGGQNLPAFRLPASAWMAAMNECDRAIDLAGGGTEPQFRCGMEITGDMEPLAVIEELLKSCSGRLAEVGGIFKPIVGVPASSVYSFTDGDILVTREQGFKPFPRLDDTYNGIEATYNEPAEAWSRKDAPARYSSELEAEDGNRRLVAGVNFPAVPYGTQVQRLMKAMIEEERRFRIHQFFLPPDAWLLEPNDVIDWTSARNGYEAKKFIVIDIVGERTMNQGVLLKEIDPDDYDWSSDEEQPIVVAPLGPIRAPAQAIVDWFAEGITEIINGKQRACISLSWDGDIEDVARVAWEVRRADTLAVVHTGGTDSVAAGQALISQNLMSDEDYQARGIYVPHTGRQTLWSDWLTVRTPKSPQTDIMAGLLQQAADMRNLLERMVRQYQEEVIPRIEELAGSTAEGLGATSQEIAAVVRKGDALAAAFVFLDAALKSEVSARAAAILGVETKVGDVSAGGRFAVVAQIPPPEGVLAQMEQIIRVEAGGEDVNTGQVYRIVDEGGELRGYIDTFAHRWRLISPDGETAGIPITFEGNVMTLASMRAQTITAGLFQSEDEESYLDLRPGSVGLRLRF